MKQKWPFLFLLIALPILVYAFLQIYGENRFELPIYYQEGILEPLEGCDSVNMVPYEINHFSVSAVGYVTVYGFSTGKGFSDEEINNLNTFFTKYETSDSVRFASLSTDLLLNQKLESGLVNSEIAGRQSIIDYARCGLQLDLSYDSENRIFNGNQLVLCDKDRKIRGYYDIKELKEIDRLNTELAILIGQPDEE